jgi:hypothetical protein
MVCIVILESPNKTLCQSRTDVMTRLSLWNYSLETLEHGFERERLLGQQRGNERNSVFRPFLTDTSRRWNRHKVWPSVSMELHGILLRDCSARTLQSLGANSAVQGIRPNNRRNRLNETL